MDSDRQKYGWIGGRTDKRTDGRADGWIEQSKAKGWNGAFFVLVISTKRKKKIFISHVRVIPVMNKVHANVEKMYKNKC